MRDIEKRVSLFHLMRPVEVVELPAAFGKRSNDTTF